ncbi:unnamed protein product [Symbiodinium natans]|uniref:J domain-containing protein n=1 Tax=Symbiodinium natans TaxID=878477 RepID=A0A812S6T3_9DINO|nr:unnamed protein product [Symbiodinium natans]
MLKLRPTPLTPLKCEHTSVEGMKHASAGSEWVLPLAVVCFWPGAATQTSTSTTQTTVTSTVPPYQYFQGDWSTCSATCAVGTRTREVFCYETCSVPQFCEVAEAFCRDSPKPADFDYCWPAVVSCPDSTTGTFTTTFTSTFSTNTQTVTSQTSTQGVRPGWQCAWDATTGCVIGSIAQVQCGSNCPCCRRADVKSTTPRPFEPTDTGNEVSAAVIVIVALTSVALGSGFAVAGWRSCAKSRRKTHATGSHVPKAEAYGHGDSQTGPRRVREERAGQHEEDTVYDRKLGKGIPSAAPDGFFDGPPDWMNDEEMGASSPSRDRATSRSQTATGNLFTGSEEKEKARSTQSSPMKKGRHDGALAFHRAMDSHRVAAPCLDALRFMPAEAGKDDSDHFAQQESPRVSPTSPSGTLPPGYASAARRNRRTGKQMPDMDDFASDSQHVPGEANTASPRQSHSKTAAPSGKAQQEQKDEPRGKQDRSHHDGPRAAGNADDEPGRKSKQQNKQGMPGASGTPHGDEQRTNPRVAANSAAAPEAADLIAKVDKELDQTQSKDLETRRRTFKNLILKWHPDKNHEEALAAEVFRHLMSRRGRYLEA